MAFIGMDLGTSFIKGAVLDLEERRLEHVQRKPFPGQLTSVNPFECEFDPHEIVAAANTVISERASYAPGCEGIVMCSQRHGIVLMNGRGQTMSNCIT